MSGPSRREFLAGLAAAAAGAALQGCRRAAEPPLPPGALLGADVASGHRLRGRAFPAPAREETVGVVIAGGGIAALSAAWQLSRSGFHDYLLLEMGARTGGNAAWGEGAGGRFPWGAHYLPLPGEEAVSVRALLRELGVITGADAGGRPLYDETMLCAAPEERLLYRGRWQAGLLPERGLAAAERDEITAFFAEIDRWRERRGSDGRRFFTIPVSAGSHDPAVRGLDAITMAAWLDAHGWRSAPLRWFLNYCCRDDYGAGIASVSAWAGIHYFAARPRNPAGPLTWPEGNGWLAERLRERLRGRIRERALVHRIAETRGGIEVDALDLNGGGGLRVRARRAISALPRFVARRVVEPLRGAPADAPAFEYSPWFVANVTVPEIPAGPGAPPAWDNVFYDSCSLGYVDATHQRLELRPSPVTLTWYRPLDDAPPPEARAAALARPFAEWQRAVIADLERHHPGITPTITRLDGWLWGHGMIRPTPGFMTGAGRAAAARPLGAVHFAHSDLSGLSIFEEAQDRGVAAANEILRALGLKAEPLA